MEQLEILSEQYLDGLLTVDEYRKEFIKKVSELDEYSLVTLAQRIFGEA